MTEKMISQDRITIRPFDYSDTDYTLMLRVYVANFPDEPASVGRWRFQDEKRDKKKFFSRNIVEVDGEHVGTVGFGAAPWADVPGLYFVGGSVHPDFQRQGLGCRMYDFAIEQLLPHRPKTIRAAARDDKADALAMLKKRGFVCAQREAVSALNVDEFDANRYTALLQKLADAGIRIRSLEAIQQTDPAWQQHMYDLKWTLLGDVPTIEPIRKMPFSEWVDIQFENPGFKPDAWFVAEDLTQAAQPCYVGISHLYRNQAKADRLDVGLTGVLGDYRRRGIATALKARAAMFAQSFGASEIWTDNAEENPMYQLNLQLGFRPKPSMLIFNKEIGDD